MGKVSGRDITKGSIWKNLLIYFFPIWFGSIFQQMYTTVDAVVVGRFVGKAALAALGGTSSLLVDLSVGFCIGASAGAGVVVSHCYGWSDTLSSGLFLRCYSFAAVQYGFRGAPGDWGCKTSVIFSHSYHCGQYRTGRVVCRCV